MASEFLNLLEQRRNQMSSGNKKQMDKAKLPPALYPSAIEKQYQNWAIQLMKGFTKPITELLTVEYIQTLIDGMRGDSILDEFNRVIGELKEKANNLFSANNANGSNNKIFVATTSLSLSEKNQQQTGKQFSKILGFKYTQTTPDEAAVIQAWSKNNEELLEGLGRDYIKSTNTIVSDGVLSGRSARQIRKELLKNNKKLGVNRAKLIARDQVGKLNGMLTQRRMKSAGLDLYTWSTAGDERVRGNPAGKYPKAIPSHFIMNDIICKWDNNEVYSTDGKTWKPRTAKMFIGIPGEDYNCRCTAIPYMANIYKSVE